MLGPALAIVLAIATSISYGVPYCIGVLVIFGISQVAENQFLRPLVFSKFMDINPLVVIISLLVGAKFLGLWGAILAPVVASVFIVLIDELYIKTINQEEQ
ncbi:AI-2E family transporter [bacterium]|nr:AI-2E family transporter [bacterium]